MRGYHDIGGRCSGPIDRTELPWQEWEQRVEAIRNLLGDATRRVMSLDEVRHGFESFGEDKYMRWSFYRRRLEAMIDTLEHKGLVTRAEIDALVAQRWSTPADDGADR